ncbi:hypothetical protein FA95DRAFT_1612660 [Auriscalpium vulgare]|uniref:Uncharacterized protein n=1 Tax=Auriscalpium vulgare TaxID=40419 RepID=A0ACB8R6B4_9AGAM|nr:hypothetical protein FA95DRAFT_1612660 [Auriscalpium vulgare]
MKVAGRRRNAPRKRPGRPQPDLEPLPLVPDMGIMDLPDTVTERFDGMLHLAAEKMCEHPEIVQIFEEAKQKLGVSAAGASVEDFVRMNTRRVDVDPWRDTYADILAGRGNMQPHATGTESPLTFDVVVPFMPGLAPTTKQPHLVYIEHKIIVPMYHAAPIIMRGRWEYAALLPEPGEGRTLGPDEWVRALVGRFTTPFIREEGSSPGQLPPGVEKIVVGGDNDEVGDEDDEGE